MQNEPKNQEAIKEIWVHAPNRSCRLSLHALFFCYTKKRTSACDTPISEIASGTKFKIPEANIVQSLDWFY
ncbi:MAG: hypothetical protein CMC74_03295 [Flavobacteriaceae bacterium]|nr:hypothetical protein [Flavobacteriaceae bacterium]|tara:strand:- start:71 stop:283 length:213 start_codon:yes stop_codon:yes gene_type:complete